MRAIDQRINTKQKVINHSVDPTKVTNILYRQISLGLSITGVILGAFIYLTAPSRDNDTAIKLQEQRINSQQTTIDTITKTQQNDTQEVKKALENNNVQLQLQAQEITKLTTIIDERIPKKK